jgi:hypothetical protein
MAKTFSQIVEEVVRSVRAQAARAHLPGYPGHPSSALIVRHVDAALARDGVPRPIPVKLRAPVIEAVRDRLAEVEPA